MSIPERLRRDWPAIAWSAIFVGFLTASSLVDDRTENLVTIAFLLLFVSHLCAHVVRRLRNARPRY